MKTIDLLWYVFCLLLSFIFMTCLVSLGSAVQGRIKRWVDQRKTGRGNGT